MPDFTQCDLARGAAHTTSWIPSELARRGAVLRLKEFGLWGDGWVVQAVHQTLPESQIIDPHHEIKAHRRDTGDSLPKKHRR